MKTQTITRKGLQELWETVKNCSTWKSKIENYLKADLFSNEIEISQSDITDAFKAANKAQMTVLSKYFEKQKSIIDKVKDIDDIFRILGTTYGEVVPWKKPKNKKQKSQNALSLIQCITEVYNEGVELDWDDSTQYKYYPYFEKKAHGGGWVVVSCACYCAVARLCSGCYYKSSEVALDAANKFLHIYRDYLPE